MPLPQPSPNLYAVCRLQAKVILNIIDNYWFIDAPAGFLEVFKVGLSFKAWVVPVYTLRYSFGWVDPINYPIGVSLASGCEDDDLVGFGNLFYEDLSIWTD